MNDLKKYEVNLIMKVQDARIVWAKNKIEAIHKAKTFDGVENQEMGDVIGSTYNNKSRDCYVEELIE